MPKKSDKAHVFESAEVSVKEIHPDPNQIRKEFDEDKLEELATSIGNFGLLAPILVTPSHVGGKPNGYRIIAGERRWRAAQMAALQTVPVRIVDGKLDRKKITELQIEENDKRENVNEIERAVALKSLYDDGMKMGEIAQRFGKSQPWVSNQLSLLDYPDYIQSRVKGGELSPAHVRALNPYRKWPEVMAEVHEMTNGVEMSRDDFQMTVYECVCRMSRPMERGVPGGPLFRITKERRKELDIFTVSKPGDSAPMERAKNIGLWDEWQDEAKQASRGTASEEPAKSNSSGADDPDAVESPAGETVEATEATVKDTSGKSDVDPYEWEVVEWLRVCASYAVEHAKAGQLAGVASWCSIMVMETEMVTAARIGVLRDDPEVAGTPDTTKTKLAIRGMLSAKAGNIRLMLQHAVATVELANVLLDLCEALGVDVFDGYFPSWYLLETLSDDQVKRLPRGADLERGLESTELRTFVSDNYSVGEMPGRLRQLLEREIKENNAERLADEEAAKGE